MLLYSYKKDVKHAHPYHSLSLFLVIKLPKYSLKQQNCTIIFGIQLMPEKLGKVCRVLMLFII